MEPGARENHSWGRWALLLLFALPFLLSPVVQGRDDAPLLVDRAAVKLSRNDPPGALADCRLAVRLDPRSSEAANGLARAFEALGELDSAAAVYEKFVQQMENQPHTLAERRLELRNLASVCWRRGDLRRAIGPLAVLQREGAGTLRTDLQLVVAYRLDGDLAAARHVRDEMLKRYGRVEALWRLDALLETRSPAALERSLVEALTRLRILPTGFEPLRAEAESALARGCHSDLVHAVLGEAALQDAQPEVAVTELAAIQDESFASLREYGLALAALAREEPAIALTHLDRAAADPSFPRELEQFQRGRALFARGDVEAARGVLQEAAAANPLSVRANRLLGELERSAGSIEAAASAYERVLEIDPADQDAIAQLRALHARMGRS